jgi:signal transduction histidine kinase
MASLQTQIEYRLARLKDDIEIRQRDGLGAARRNIQSNGGLDSMRAITTLIDVTVASQNGLLTERLARSFEAEQNVGTFAKAGMLLTFAILLLGAGLIWLALRERALQQEALQRANAVIAQTQKMETLGKLSGGIAHDFNNMLTVIKSGIELLRRRLETTDPEALKFVDGIDGGANRAASLTQRLLAFSRRRPLAPKPIDPNRLVAGMSDLLHRTLGGSVEIETVLLAHSWVSADPNQLENAILNLAVNARDAMPGGGRLIIRTADVAFDDASAAAQEAVPAGRYVMISASDNGQGMTPEVMNKVFEPFFTTKEEGQGTGLGLSQIHGLVEQSAGHVRIASEVDKGTTVTLYLPITAAEHG